MAKHKDPLLEALAEGNAYTWTVPDGGNLASMRNAIEHGQTLTMSPIGDPSEIQVGDMVLVRWHKTTLFHLVGDIQDDQYLIVNSLGKVNGWVKAEEILGRVTKIVEPEPRLEVAVMLEQLEMMYHAFIQRGQPSDADAQRLLAVVDDLRWYTERIGAERWDEMPRANKWSFAQNLWHLLKRTRNATADAPNWMQSLIDRGKRCVGLASEIITLFDTPPD